MIRSTGYRCAAFLPAKSSSSTIFIKRTDSSMDKPKTYCQAVSNMAKDSLHKIYHDTAYGFPIHDDNELFERLILEINQAGLSWTTILNKQQNFKKAYHGFEIKKVAGYKEKDRQRLLNDAGIIRNRLKIDAAIANANTILQLQKEFGSFKKWIDSHHPLTKDEWVKLFKKTFRFTGGEIVNEFLMSTGYLAGVHEENCPVYKKILKQKPAWSLKK
jgi:DNA-3-methyladenine glycosylase I